MTNPTRILLSHATHGSVALRSPEVGDTWTLNSNMVINQTMDKTTLIYKGSRPSFLNQTISSVVNTKANMEAMMIFLANTAGLLIGLKYQTHNGTQYIDTVTSEGFIITPVNDIITVRDRRTGGLYTLNGHNDSYSVSFTYQYKKESLFVYIFPGIEDCTP